MTATVEVAATKQKKSWMMGGVGGGCAVYFLADFFLAITATDTEC